MLSLSYTEWSQMLWLSQLNQALGYKAEVHTHTHTHTDTRTHTPDDADAFVSSSDGFD